MRVRTRALVAVRCRRVLRVAIVAIVASLVAACGQPARQSPAMPKLDPFASDMLGESLVRVKATVEEIDLESRRVRLRDQDGKGFTVRASARVGNLDQIQVADEVSVTFYESLAYGVHKTGGRDSRAELVAASQRVLPGEQPSISGAATASFVGTIAALGQKPASVTLRFPHGDETTLKVRDPRRLIGAQVGDLVEITYTEALAIALVKRSP